MKKTVEFYHFSPTGGTKKVGETLAHALGEVVSEWNLGQMMRTDGAADAESGAELAVAAMPVFGGRLPAAAAEYLKTRKGNGKKIVSLVVYGVRAYEDALLELNDILTEAGFQVIASGAFIAQHSIVPCVGQGRPDEEDKQELTAFAKQVLDKLEALGENEAAPITVPGNRPYKEGMKTAAAPICLPTCKQCGICEAACSTNAIRITEAGVETDLSKCLLCMACKAVCPSGARILPPPMQEAMNQKLDALKDVRRANEVFL